MQRFLTFDAGRDSMTETKFAREILQEVGRRRRVCTHKSSATVSRVLCCTASAGRRTRQPVPNDERDGQIRFPNYTCRTFALRELFRAQNGLPLMSNGRGADTGFKSYCRRWCYSDVGGRQWLAFLRLCALIDWQVQEDAGATICLRPAQSGRTGEVGYHIQLADCALKIKRLFLGQARVGMDGQLEGTNLCEALPLLKNLGGVVAACNEKSSGSSEGELLTRPASLRPWTWSLALK